MIGFANHGLLVALIAGSYMCKLMHKLHGTPHVHTC